MCVCDALPQALFFRKKKRSGYFYALCVCDALPQTLIFGKNDVPVISRTCTSPVEDFSFAAGALFPANSDSQMALGIFVMGQQQ